MSTLLGLSFPKGNVGKLIKGLVHHLTETEKAVAYRRNSEQLLSKFLKIADEVSLFGMLLSTRSKTLKLISPEE